MTTWHRDARRRAPDTSRRAAASRAGTTACPTTPSSTSATRRLAGVGDLTRRPRRLRRTPALRRLVAEARLSIDDLVAPLFVRAGIDEPAAIASLPGVVQHTRESLRKEVAALADLGIPGIILFGVPASKDAV